MDSNIEKIQYNLLNVFFFLSVRSFKNALPNVVYFNSKNWIAGNYKVTAKASPQCCYFFHLSGNSPLRYFLFVLGFTIINLFSRSLKYSNVLILFSLHEHASEYINAALFAPWWLPQNSEFLLLRLIYLLILSMALLSISYSGLKCIIT